MILLLHICIALASMGYTTFLYISPTKNRLQLSSGLVAATVVSGTYLVMNSPAHIVEACMVGLVYIATMLAALVAARNKLASSAVEK